MRFLSRFISFCVLISFSFISFSQVKNPLTFSGRITDGGTGEPLPGTSIYFTDARLGAIADANGNFLFRNVPPGHHLIEISHAGYNTVVDHIDLKGSLEKNFVLSAAIVEDQGVIVTGVTSATSTRTAPIPVNIIRREELMQTPSNNIIDALSRVPGISQVATGPAISKPIIRGLGYNRVVVVNDGARQEGQQWGDEHGIEIDELSVNRVEVIKGPASIMYGSDAIAGVINIITHQPIAENTIRGNIFNSYHTNNRMSGLHAAMAGNVKGFNWNVYGSRKSAIDYKNKYDGRVFNSRFKEQNFGGYIGLNKSWGFSHLIISNFNQNVGLVEGERDPITGEFLVDAGGPNEHIAYVYELESRDLETPKQNIQHFKVVSDNNFRVGEGRIKLNVGYQKNERSEYGDHQLPHVAGLVFDLQTFTYNLQWRLREKDTWHTTIGLGGMNQQNQNKAEEVIIPEYKLFDIGGFVYSQKSYKNLTVTGGLRVDQRSLKSQSLEVGGSPKFQSLNKNYINFSGSLGLSFHPKDAFILKANLARGFRAPTISELASNGAHEGTNRYEYGDASLKSEKSLQADIGVDVDNEHFSFSLSGFINHIEDFIFYRRLNSVVGGDSILLEDGEAFEAFRYSQQNVILSGLEASFDFHPHPIHWLHFENTISVIRGRFSKVIDGSDNMPMIPAARLVSELRANINKPTASTRNFYFKVEMDHSFAQNKPFYGFNTETTSKAYTFLNAGAGLTILSREKPWFSLHISGSNLTDEAYQQHLNRLRYRGVNNATGRMGIYNMGKNFVFKIQIPIEYSIK